VSGEKIMTKRKTYLNGNIYTGEGFAECFTEENGVFTYVGDACGLPEDKGEVIDLGGRFVCAGFNDSHMHLLNLGSTLSIANLGAHTTSIADIQQCLRDYIAENPPTPGSWVCGRGFNQDYFAEGPVFPTRWDLDAVSTEYPICITRACGHICVVNSKVLELVGITKDTPSLKADASMWMKTANPTVSCLKMHRTPYTPLCPYPIKTVCVPALRKAVPV
jgi:predicted amidohydrolase YtcJ